ncbi:autotransporter beta-domain protein, partial [Chlamydia psittaci 84-8471/1]
VEFLFQYFLRIYL